MSFERLTPSLTGSTAPIAVGTPVVGPRPSLGAWSATDSVAGHLRLSSGVTAVRNGESAVRSGIRSYVSVRPSLVTASVLDSTVPCSTKVSVVEQKYGLVRDLDKDMHGMEWQQTALVIFAEICGIGVLGIPGSLRTLGWTVGILALVLSCLWNLYNGLLIERLRRVAPASLTFGDLMDACVGYCASWCTWIFVYVFILGILGEALVTMAASVQGIVQSGETEKGDSKTVSYVVTICLTLCTNQLRRFEGCTTLCLFSSAAVLLAVALCLGDILISGCSGSDSNEGGSFWSLFGALSSYSLAYGGQYMFLEMMSEMREPQKFSWSLYLTYPIFAVVYTTVGVVTYATCGENVPSFLLDAVKPGTALKRTASALIFGHTLVSYTLNQQVLARGLHLFLDPRHANVLNRRESGFWRSWISWTVITSVLLALALCLAVSVKDFGTGLTLVGSLFATPLNLVFPVLALLCVPREVVSELRRSCVEVVLSSATLVFALVATVLGTGDAVRNIAK